MNLLEKKAQKCITFFYIHCVNYFLINQKQKKKLARMFDKNTYIENYSIMIITLYIKKSITMRRRQKLQNSTII